MAQDQLQGEFILKNETSPPDIYQTEREPDTISPSKQTIKNAPPLQGVKGHSKPHFYSAFSYYPKGIKFQDQEQDEEVILLVRQHFITNVPWILGIFLLGLLPVLLSFLIPFFPFLLLISQELLFLSLLFYYLILFSFALLYFTIWYFNVGIITNKRLIDIDVHNILVRVLSEARLNSIQDVTVTQVGGIRSIFNYGDIDIQTEALKQNIEFYRVPRPNFIRTVVGNLVVHRK